MHTEPFLCLLPSARLAACTIPSCRQNRLREAEAWPTAVQQTRGTEQASRRLLLTVSALLLLGNPVCL